MNLSVLLPMLLAFACLLPLLAAVTAALVGRRLPGHGIWTARLATLAIMGSLVLSVIALGCWIYVHGAVPAGHGSPAANVPQASPLNPTAYRAYEPMPYVGTWYTLVRIGSWHWDVGYYIDALTLVLFCLVAGIATCVHLYALRYMEDHLPAANLTPAGQIVPTEELFVHRGRYGEFFQTLAFFCACMLGLLVAGNLLLLFMCWELVGFASYLLIGFYRERLEAGRAATQAFLYNRVGDIGFLVGIALFGAALGTVNFGDVGSQRGMFSQVRPATNHHQLLVPIGFVRAAARPEIAAAFRASTDDVGVRQRLAAQQPDWIAQHYGYGWLTLAGLLLVCGSMGKSAQVPLHAWLTSAMAGPTPVSALVHSATMVAAGVYLVARCYPLFTAEVLLVVAYIGMISVVVGAAFALVANDLKRLLAFSTISQLGYMLLGLGVGGWFAGVFHLVTHACLKSLLFLGAGIVIHACGTGDLRQLGGLRRELPWTATCLLIGCLAGIGAGIPGLEWGLSGYYSKDAILAQALLFWQENPLHGLLFWMPLIGAAMTAFYLFRMWFLLFAAPAHAAAATHAEAAGHALHPHGSHEAAPLFRYPLAVLAVLSICVAWSLPWSQVGLTSLLEQARPAGLEMAGDFALRGLQWTSIAVPVESRSHTEAIPRLAGWATLFTALAGVLVAASMFVWKTLPQRDLARQFPGLAAYLEAEGHWNTLAECLVVRPARSLAGCVIWLDQAVFDRLLNGVASAGRFCAQCDDRFDRRILDASFDRLASATYATGQYLRTLQSGRLRQYVLLILLGTAALYVLAGMVQHWSAGGP